MDWLEILVKTFLEYHPIGHQKGDVIRHVLDVLGSKTFLQVFFIINKIFLPQIMATKRYDQNSKEIIYDKKIYVSETQQWVRKPSGRRLAKPSYIEAHKTFTTKF